MSLRKARESLGMFAQDLKSVQDRLAALEEEVLRKSETLARLERAKSNPVSLTVGLVQKELHPPPGRPSLFALSGLNQPGAVRLRPTTTRVANEHALPPIEQESLEASEVKPWLYLAGNLIARDAEKMHEKGITRVLNVAHTVCPNYHEGEFEYTSLDLIDHPSESIDHFILQAIAEIERAREDSVKILVHCHQGVSRSASLVVAYVAWKDNLSIQDALMYVKARRRIVSPNAGFLDQLKAFESRLRGARTEPALFDVVPHSEQVSTLILKEIFDKNRALIDEDDVFVVFEGQGGHLLVREPRVRAENYSELMATAHKVAGWMVRFESAFRFAMVVDVPSDDARFRSALERIPDGQREHLYH
jgi:protein-tyrosine phosphatase